MLGVSSFVLFAAQAGGLPLCAVEEQKIVPADGEFLQNFGFTVAVEGDTALIGAPGDNDGAGGGGSVYVYRHDGVAWGLETELIPSDVSIGDRFGEALDLEGDTAVIGSPLNDLNAGPPNSERGAVFVFQRTGTTWTQVTRLAASDAEDGDEFGRSVAISGDWMAVGAPWDDDAVPQSPFANSGAVYVFERVTGSWTQRQKLTASDTAVRLYFGLALDLDGDVLVVGGPGAAGPLGEFNQGAAYVFDRSGTSFSESQLLLASDGSEFDQFGEALSLEADRLVIGATRADGTLPEGGAVYVFERAAGVFAEGQKLVTGDVPPAPNTFGADVDVEGDVLVVGALFDGDGGGPGAGATYVFARDAGGWTQRDKLVAADAAGSDLAYKCGVSSGRVIVGAQRDDDMGSASGSAYSYRLLREPRTYCIGKTSSLGCVPFLTSSGIPSATPGLAFEITGHDLLPGEAAFLLYGFARSNLGFHGGKLCVKAPFTRLLPPQIAKSTGTPPCSGEFTRGLNKRIQSGVDPLLSVGQRVTTQLRQRDNADPAGFGDSLTDGVEFFICP